MPTAEYYQKQIELLLLWASATTSRDLQVKLIERACQLLALANCADDQTLRYLEEVMESAFAKFLNRLRERASEAHVPYVIFHQLHSRDTVTCPVPPKPIARAAAGVRSISLPRTQGPRSLIRTVTHLP